jgi:hypothetical protein
MVTGSGLEVQPRIGRDHVGNAVPRRVWVTFTGKLFRNLSIHMLHIHALSAQFGGVDIVLQQRPGALGSVADRPRDIWDATAC